MLTRPEHGWSEVCIGEHRLRISYIEPVPQMLLTAFIRALSTHGTADVTFDAEGWTWCLQSDCVTRLTIMADATETFTVPVTVRELGQEALADFQRDLDAWSSGWSCLNRPEQAENERAEIIRLCRQLERLL
ncbi:MAG: hypothetical protein E7318_02380 [Clostridiales bacterium]|nr:hypothetical protein [Clostridiales bacterium]